MPARSIVAPLLAARPRFPPLSATAATTLQEARTGGRGVVTGLLLLPLLVHVTFQPGLGLTAGGAEVNVALSDLAALALVAGAAVVAAREGLGALRRGLLVWLAGAVALAWIGVATLLAAVRLDDYSFAAHAVTAAGAAEYALLAPAVALLVRSAADLRALLGVLVAWACLAAIVGVAQFLGAPVFDAWRAGFRQPSFLGHHDLAALAGVVFVVGLASAALRRPFRGRLATSAALAGGGLGLVVAASVASLLGVALALAVLGILGIGRGAAVPGLLVAVAVAGAVAAGVLALRGGDLAELFRLARPAEAVTRPTDDVETYVHRTVIAYVGWRIFREHPLTGAGWQASTEPEVFEPHVPAARQRFPEAAPLSFPARDRPHGVQNAYVQALSDLGLLGAAALAALFGAAAGLAAAAARADSSGSALAGLLALLVLLGVWSAQGLVVGIPMLALTAVALGLCARPLRVPAAPEEAA
jgi:O-antigen ligase